MPTDPTTTAAGLPTYPEVLDALNGTTDALSRLLGAVRGLFASASTQDGYAAAVDELRAAARRRAVDDRQGTPRVHPTRLCRVDRHATARACHERGGGVMHNAGRWMGRPCQPLHQPVVASMPDGRWGVFCDACSHDAQDYVYPCRLDLIRSEGWPPAILDSASASGCAVCGCVEADHMPDGFCTGRCGSSTNCRRQEVPVVTGPLENSDPGVPARFDYDEEEAVTETAACVVWVVIAEYGYDVGDRVWGVFATEAEAEARAREKFKRAETLHPTRFHIERYVVGEPES